MDLIRLYQRTSFMSWNRKAWALSAVVAVAACGVETPTEVSDAPDFAVVTSSSDAIPDRYIKIGRAHV